MPGATTDQGIVIPIGTDVADNPDAFVDMLAGVETRLVKRYASRAARSANNPAPSTDEISEIAGETWLERYTGAKWLPITPIQAFKTADEIVNNSTALIDDAELVVPIPAVVANWAIEGWINYRSASAADIKFRFVSDAAIGTPSGYSILGPDTASASRTDTNVSITATTALSTTTPLGGVSAAAGTEIGAPLNGGLTSSGTAGVLHLQWAQNSADVSDTRVLARSWLRLTAIS